MYKDKGASKSDYTTKQSYSWRKQFIEIEHSFTFWNKSYIKRLKETGTLRKYTSNNPNKYEQQQQTTQQNCINMAVKTPENEHGNS